VPRSHVAWFEAWQARLFVTGFILFFPIILALLGKTSRRSFTMSPEGISTQIGSTSGQISWQKVQIVSEQRDYILIARSNGNAFFIPSRAFLSTDQKHLFFATAKAYTDAAKK
jgi:YcxB-like protein